MKHPDAREIIELTRKLEKQDDITLKEADRIFSLLSKSSLNTKLNYYSSRANNFLINAVGEWFQVVAEKIKQGKRGNFIFTIAISNIPVDNSGGFYDFARVALNDAKETLEKYGCAEDLFTELLIDEKIYNTIPEEFQKLFTKKYVDSRLKSFYILKNPRAGMLNYPIETDAGACTIAKFLKKFSPAIVTPTSMTYKQLKTIFEIASGVSDIPDTWTSGREVKLFILSYFIKFQDFPCIMAGDMHRSIVFVEERNAPMMKIASETPFEELIENALSNNIIDKITAWEIESYFGLENPSARKFVKTSAEYLDEKVRLKMAREYMQEMTAQEWMEEIR